MKFKYMIRGLGLGVMITAAVMGAYSRNAVADARVAVLREYGFGEESRLVDETENAEDLSDVGPTEPVIVRDEEKEAEISSVLDAAKEAEQTDMTMTGPDADEHSSVETSDVESSDNESSREDSSESPSAIVVTPSDENVTGETVDIVIASGDDSGTVARKLYNAGIIENASEYDAFLMQHGYDKKLSTGTKTIGMSDSWQEIADKITR